MKKTDIWLCFKGTEGVREKSQERDKFSGDGGGEEAGRGCPEKKEKKNRRKIASCKEVFKWSKREAQ